ncbi:hypothetical protein MAM1_0302d09445 [Mucor ambiguus]|uniref:Uncharacterized protein n=1 Tax=Mucor ambiguus TaxID=91626 RepID=A0A0C9N1Q1_9FUNG|nr:hypothetical protein MAM1_0302d09445 [Mucor ambiguus]
MSKRKSSKRKERSSKLLDSQNSSILDFFSQTKKEHATELNKKPKLNQGYSSFDSFASSPYDQSQKSNVTVEDVKALSSQESSFELHPDTQNSHAWSEAISEIGDFDMAPFAFDLDPISTSKNATQTDSVLSNFSDNSQLAFSPDFIDFNDTQMLTRPHSIHSFISTVESPVMSQETIVHFEDDDATESIKSTFSTQEALPQLALTDDHNDSNDARLPPISDFKFVIPTSTANLDSAVKQAPKPVTQHLKSEGITAVAFRTILQETEMHEKWEDAMSAQLAEYGNIAQVCKENDANAALFWILDSWVEGNVIFAWCTCMDDDDIEEWVSVKKADEKKEETMNSSIALIPDDDATATTNTDTIKSYPDQDLLNNMDKIPEEKFLFAFSLAYIKSRKYAKKFIEQERVVAVWPDDWSELQITLPIIGHCVANLTSKFKADSIY